MCETESQKIEPWNQILYKLLHKSLPECQTAKHSGQKVGVSKPANEKFKNLTEI